MGIIFVGGVHGVGKTTTCETLSKQLGLRHYSASDLIRSEKSDAVMDSTKIVKNVRQNQDLLVWAVRRVTNDFSDLIILDGHYTLLNSDNQIEAIQFEVFKDLKLSVAILLYDSPDAIAQRFSARDRQKISKTLIRMHQEQEILHAGIIAKRLNIHLCEFKPSEVKDLITEIYSALYSAN